MIRLISKQIRKRGKIFEWIKLNQKKKLENKKKKTKLLI